MDESGRPVMRWDGKTYKKSPTTGEDIPDESAQVPEEVYLNPRKAEWPEADFVVGNPPFIGASSMRRALGDGYVDALRKTWKEVPESCDFVMYWWNKAADLAREGKLQQFGLITTNSLRQTFNRRVIERHMGEKKPLSLVFAIPDHPWVDGGDGAAVRIAMTVGSGGTHLGALGTLSNERKTDEDTRRFDLIWKSGKIHSNLVLGADTASTQLLKANSGISSPGVKLHGSGFIVTPEQAKTLGYGTDTEVTRRIRSYRNGRDLTQSPRGVLLIDLFGLSDKGARETVPTLFQHIFDNVKPERDAKAHTKDGAGYAKQWWLFGKPRQQLRNQLIGLKRYIVTVETSKHRIFTFLAEDILPDNRLMCFAIETASALGVLSARPHLIWALAQGGRLEDRPVYTKSLCFDRYPFPEPDDVIREQITNISEQLDAHRTQQQEKHSSLTITGMYNVLEKLRREGPLTAKEKEIHEQGLVSVLRELHDDLDRAVFSAYGWDDLAEKLVGRPGATTPWPEKPEDQLEAEEELLQRLVDLNLERAGEEAQGKFRWLRPEYQAPDHTAEQGNLGTTSADGVQGKPTSPASQPMRLAWPKTLQEQIRSVRTELATRTMSSERLAARFKRTPHKSISQVLGALIELGMVEAQEDGQYRVRDC